ncbi:MFS general substrate transporter [Punctularia strigosozonata HHB-11173 SS5]|uniref:MFS general substrate transporter n=1 Tax=Punctularia strigosozonata (strain HHB-11173) TaxID=741275 RepID=UPI00044167EB|nr:MFS general substrate transporter [Punctularia strigosozonata HHB-11173 SS5]EIN14104.1 MFS general substrate transporter [Punctularia strigosozonata HHB-11173 SS5]
MSGSGPSPSHSGDLRTGTPTVIERDDGSDYSHNPDNEEIHHEQYPEPNKDGQYDPFLVRFEEGDPENPKNWSFARNTYLTIAAGGLVLNATFASSAPSGIVPQLIEEFGFGEEVATLTISLFVAGYCIGPLLWGPLSEQIGRKPVFLGTFIVYFAFQIGCALAQTTAQIIIFRFLGGMFAAAPLANSGAVLADIWDNRTRGTAMAIFTLAPFAGPAVGPIVGGYIAVSGTSWRWVFWVLAIYAGVTTIQIILTIPETYAPIILVGKAKRKRIQTGDDRYYAPMEKTKVPLKRRAEEVLGRPFKVLFREPMLIAITLYISFIYGCIYLLFEAYPIVFTQGHHFNAGASGLMFLPLPLGGATAVVMYILYWMPKYNKQVDKYHPHPVPPEVRLHMAVVGAPAFAVAFFWFGWTSFSSVNYWAPMMSGLVLGFGIQWLFLPLFNYMVDAYLFVAASALSANTVVRSLFGAGFPLFARQMYVTLNPRWASTLLGCIAVLLIPIPFLLIKFGPKLREKSKYAPTHPPRPPAEKQKESA